MSEDDARDALPAYVRGLLEPGAYPTPPAEVRLELECSAARLLFSYSSAAGRHSSGKIALAP